MKVRLPGGDLAYAIPEYEPERLAPARPPAPGAVGVGGRGEPLAEPRGPAHAAGLRPRRGVGPRPLGARPGCSAPWPATTRCCAWPRETVGRRQAGRHAPRPGRAGVSSMTLWHGRFDGGPADELMAYTASLPFDRRLAADDVVGQPGPRRGPAPGRPARRRRGRRGAGARSTRCGAELADGHVRVRADRRGHPHRHRATRHRAGRPGRAPSCTPAAAATTRWPRRCACWCKRELAAVIGRVVGLQEVLLERADEAGDAYLPGYTHLQRAQPVLLAHHLLAHGWALARDVDRLLATVARLDVSPLGAGALAGSSLPLDPAATAADARLRRRVRELPRRRQRPRLRGRGAVRPDPARRPPVPRWARSGCCGRPRSSASPGSTTPTPPARSMLPQKKNPDIAELARGKAGRLIGDLTGLPGHAEGPAAGLQPRPAGGQGAAVRRRRSGAAGPRRRITGMIATATFDLDRMQAAADGPTAAATDLAELPRRPGACRSATPTPSSGSLVRQSLEPGWAVPGRPGRRPTPTSGDEAAALLASRRRGHTPHDPGGAGPAPVAGQLERFRRSELDADALAAVRRPGAAGARPGPHRRRRCRTGRDRRGDEGGADGIDRRDAHHAAPALRPRHLRHCSPRSPS